MAAKSGKDFLYISPKYCAVPYEVNELLKPVPQEDLWRREGQEK
jgi:hypothetical protein